MRPSDEPSRRLARPPPIAPHFAKCSRLQFRSAKPSPKTLCCTFARVLTSLRRLFMSSPPFLRSTATPCGLAWSLPSQRGSSRGLRPLALVLLPLQTHSRPLQQNVRSLAVPLHTRPQWRRCKQRRAKTAISFAPLSCSSSSSNSNSAPQPPPPRPPPPAASSVTSVSS